LLYTFKIKKYKSGHQTFPVLTFYFIFRIAVMLKEPTYCRIERGIDTAVSTPEFLLSAMGASLHN
jgi:hypothetical protein